MFNVKTGPCYVLDCHVLGTIRTVQLEQVVIDTLQQKLMVDVNTASQFTRAIVHGIKFYSRAYTRVTKRNSHTVCYMDGEATRYGLIKYFLSLPNQSVAVLNRLIPTTSHCYPRGLGILCSRVVPVELDNSIDVVPINSLISKCVYCSFTTTSVYISLIPNSYTDD